MISFSTEENIDKLDLVYERSEALRNIFDELNSRGTTYDSILHCNALGPVGIPLIKDQLRKGITKGFQRVLAAVESDIPLLRSKPEEGVHFQRIFKSHPFTWLVNLLNALNYAEEFRLFIHSEEVPNQFLREQFASFITTALKREIDALHNVGDTQHVQVDEQRLEHYVNNLTKAYAPGIDAVEYTTIIASTLKKGDENEKELPQDHAVRSALARILDAVAEDIVKVSKHAQLS